MIQLAVFDWNGTLLSDVEAMMRGVENELAVFNLPPISLSQYRETYDIPLTNFYAHYGITSADIKAKSAQMSTAFHSIYEPLAAHARTRAGTRHMLDYLHSKNIKRAILSNHTIEGIYMQLERLKLTHHFETVLANDNIAGAHLKGKLNNLKYYLKDSKFEPDEVIIVGDTIEEIEIGKHLSIKTVALTGGYNSTDRLKRANPDFIINRLDDLIEILEKL